MSSPGPSEILIVDDEAPIRISLARLLEGAGHRCGLAADAAEARHLLAERDFDLMLADINMPGDSGIVLAEEVLRGHDETGVVMVTAVDDPLVAAPALDLGVYGYVVKPFESGEILINVANALRLRGLELENRSHRDRLEAMVDERTGSLARALRELEAAELALRLSHEETIQRLATAAELRDSGTGLHLTRIGRYCEALAVKLGWAPDRVELLRLASQMHDIGKIGLPDHILRCTGELTDADRGVMRGHPEIGHRILAGSRSEVLQVAGVVALTHHERFDGTGYPKGLTGDDIPLEGRIVALADVFDALTSERPYKDAFSVARSAEMIRVERGRHFDPDLADLFLEAIGETGAVKGAVA